MRKLSMAVLLFAATALPACSDEASPFAGKSAEEIATFIVFGLMDKEGAAIKAQTVATQPFTIKADIDTGTEKIETHRIVTTTSDKCTFEFDVKCDARLCNGFKLSADLSKLVGLKEPAGWEGASFTCLEPSDREWCTKMKGTTTQAFGLIPAGESSPVGGLSKRDYLDNLAKRIDAAAKYFRKEICP